MRTEKEKMLAGERYDASAPDIQAELEATHRWLARYNASLDMTPSERRKLLEERLASVGDGSVIRPPFYCDYGFNIRLGAGVFLNFNCVILDVVEVTIGDRTQIGPGETRVGHGSSSVTGWEEFGRSHLARTVPNLSQPS